MNFPNFCGSYAMRVTILYPCLISHQIADFGSCGNGIIDDGEECDCGSQCTPDSCCSPVTCRLKADAQCESGPCCDNCKVRLIDITQFFTDNLIYGPRFCPAEIAHIAEMTIFPKNLLGKTFSKWPYNRKITKKPYIRNPYRRNRVYHTYQHTRRWYHALNHNQ